MSGFVHLRLHSEYSLVDGLIRVAAGKKKGELAQYLQPLTERAAELELGALALTDLCNLFAMVKFYKAAESAGIKPIVGADVWVQPRDEESGPELVTFLACSTEGYKNLVRLVSKSYTDGQGSGRPLIARPWIEQWQGDLIALLGPRSELARSLMAGEIESAEQTLAEWQAWFPDRLYLEVQRCGRADDEAHVQATAALARLHALPLVATNDVRFLREEDFEAHEARVCINQGYTVADNRRPRDYTPQQYLKSPEEMATLFADLPEAVENTVRIAERCTVTLSFGTYYLPDFPVPEGQTVDEHLAERSRVGLQERFQETPPAAELGVYEQRLEYELGIIKKMGFPGYFLIVSDFIKWSKANGVPVGPGRGSGAGSLVAYAIRITDLDPIPYDLLFERFLNPERVSMPDFDVDFCMEGRERVIDYVANTYGRNQVGQIITYGSMAARAVVRDVARVLGYPYMVGDRIAKMIPGAPSFKGEAGGAGRTELEHALEEIPDLKHAYQTDEETTEVINMALKLEGLTRQVGKHAGGVVIAPQALTEYVPLYCEPESQSLVAQFDMKDVEDVGLVKFDFLGLRTLTIINWAVEMINARKPAEQPALDILGIPIDDARTYQTFSSGKLTAVFQMESSGMSQLATKLKPDRLEDIIALVALYRPGPMDLIPDYIERKHGRQKPEYLHPDLEPILAETQGIMVYQEQVMQIAQKLAGYSLGDADLLRRAMGKKKADEMERQRGIFVKGAQDKGIDGEVAGAIFDLMEKFASYGFNKSHSAAYALVAYQTCWLKTHYPSEFMCAVLSAEMFKTDTVVLMIDECKRMGLTVEPPSINRSQFRFTVGDQGEIIYGLGAIKGAGESALQGIIDERAANGPFTDLFDFCRRIDTRKANKRVLEALIGAGALDDLKFNRPTLLAALPQALQAAEQEAANAERGQADIFGGMQTPETAVSHQVEKQPDWGDLERLARERATLGLYLSGHPVEVHRELLDAVSSGRFNKLMEACPGSPSSDGDSAEGEGEKRRFRRGPEVLAGGWVVDIRRFGPRAQLTLDDRTGQLFIRVSEQLWDQHRRRLSTESLMFVRGRISPDDFTGGYQVRAEELLFLEDIQHRYTEGLLIQWPARGTGDLKALQAHLEPMRAEAGCPVAVRYVNGTASATIDFGPQWRVRAVGDEFEHLKRLVGPQDVQVRYRSMAMNDV